MWGDTHHTLASQLREMLVPQITPTYIAKVEPYPIQDRSAEQDIGIMYPDIAVLAKSDQSKPAKASEAKLAVSPATALLPHLSDIEVRIPIVHIYDRQRNQLVTAIEILSPVNKREPQLSEYRHKRTALRRHGVHLLEIDLIRRGQLPLQHAQLPASDYRVILERAGQPQSEIWAFDLPDTLPVLPVPLAGSDPDALLDLGAALREIYHRNRYDLMVDYQGSPPPPALNDSRKDWLRTILARWSADHSPEA